MENVNRYRPEITLRTGAKVKMKVKFTGKQRVYRSPYYLCTQLWDKLDDHESIQLSSNIIEFKPKSQNHNIYLSEL